MRWVFLCLLAPLSSVFGFFAYVTDKEAGAVFIINTDTQTAIGTVSSTGFPAFVNPVAIVTAPDGLTAYVADSGKLQSLRDRHQPEQSKFQ